ncbi:MAG: 4Fe-4S dicluster domain-containing protein [Thermoleophilia bacterium]
MSDIISIIQRVLDDVDLVLGWTATGAGGVAAPARFQTAAEAERAVFNATCVHNLAVHLPRLKDKTVGIVAKGCDSRSVAQLIQEREIDRDRVKVIGVHGLGGMIDVRKIWRYHGYGVLVDARINSLFIDGKEIDRKEYLKQKCLGCRDTDPVIYDELFEAQGPAITGITAAATVESALSGTGLGTSLTAAEAMTAAGEAESRPLSELFAKMNPVERRLFWREQYSRCIRCYACREACPMCFCRDVCIMQTTDPHWTGAGVDAGEAEMMQLIRVNHLAGRCTGCGECERACPVGIPLMLLMNEQNQAIEELFGHRAGTDLEARPPLLTFDIKGDGRSEK